MKTRALLFAFICAALTGCTSRMDYRSGLDEKMLVVNSVIRTDVTRHGISVSASTLRDGTSRVDDAVVNVYINGKYHCVAEFYTPPQMDDSFESYLLYNMNEHRPGYYFDADLHEGDEIRLDVTWEGLHASASTVVPKAAELVSIDTVTVKQNPYFDNCDALKCAVRMRDVPGEDNWLRLMTDYHVDVVRHCGDGPQNDSLEMWSTGPASLFFDDDPVLRGSFHSSREQEAISQTDLNLPLVTNKYCIFPDTGFADSDHTADIYLRASMFYTPEPHPLYPLTKNESLTFRLLSINRDDYLYLSAYTNAETNHLLNSGEVITQILFEPVTFPSNVEGGLGFVCAEAVSTIRIDLPSVLIPARGE